MTSAIAAPAQGRSITGSTPQLWQMPRLSPREREVLVRWLACDSKAELGTQLYLSVSTINTHLARIRDKYAAVGRPAPTKTALLARALQDELITLDAL